ncbi:stage III sporulation protein AG [Candidatus Galacturonibacter soehngenii]|uniref:Stage III sporulation protein AG n=1 Tax=Candidatus Galacturonatibacter soehngenii TaxID=2307010 RepID=A0A7V7QKY6_9FIRM|nr:stage III sporulation protein AG [Candidatus Galacturonibacter soehngenii]KAB1438166.1 stage III sporulation protein AG [Candidatus Galacturonibacter soehngenii]
MEWKNKLQDIKLSFKNMKKDNFIIVLLVGVLLIVITLPTSDRSSKEGNDNKKVPSVSETTSNQNDTQTLSYVEEQEKRLETILSKVQGVGEVNVMITLKSSKELIVEKDTPATSSIMQEEDAEGGKRSTTDKSTTEATVYQQDNSGGSTPYVVKEIEPEIEGIIVIAKGGDDPVVAKNISDAILALFRVEVHKIKVMKMN